MTLTPAQMALAREIRADTDKQVDRADTGGRVNAQHVAIETGTRKANGLPTFIHELDGPGNFIPRTTAPDGIREPTEENTMNESPNPTITGNTATHQRRPALLAADQPVEPRDVMLDIDDLADLNQADVIDYLEHLNIRELRTLIVSAQVSQKEHFRRRDLAEIFEGTIRSVLREAMNSAPSDNVVPAAVSSGR